VCFIGHLYEQGVGIGLGMDRDRPQAEPPRRLDDPARDLAAIGDENGSENRLSSP
jgi:hypothetical protein